MSNILLLEDDLSLIDGLQYTLEASGYMVDNAKTVKEALALFRKNTYDLLLLDVTLPDGTGFDVCKAVRNSSTVPIIFLTASDQEISIVRGLDMGADDYITKPFNILEVKARIKAIIRRNKRKAPAKPEEPKVITSGKLKLDIEAKRLYIEDREIRLTVKEFDILKLLAENPGKIYGREQLLTLIWGSKYPGDARTVDVNVRRLREKVEENPAKPEYIHTKWGMGYYFQG